MSTTSAMAVGVLVAVVGFPLAAIAGPPARSDFVIYTQGRPDWAGQEQVYRAPPTVTARRPSVTPEQQLQRFFEAVQGGQLDQAAAMIARRPLSISEQQLRERLALWAGQIGGQRPFKVLNGRQADDFALVRVAFDAEGADVRPVVLFVEDGDWKVVWELIGLQPAQVEDQHPQAAQRLEPLYDWYAEVQRVSPQPAGSFDRVGEPATLSEEARERFRRGGGATQRADEAAGSRQPSG